MNEMNLEKVTELCLDVLEYIHQNYYGPCYTESSKTSYTKVRLPNNGLIGLVNNLKSLPIYIELNLGKLKYDFDLSRIIQNMDGRYTWYLAIPKNTKNKKILCDFGLTKETIPVYIYEEMKEQHKTVKSADRTNVGKY